MTRTFVSRTQHAIEVFVSWSVCLRCHDMWSSFGQFRPGMWLVEKRSRRQHTGEFEESWMLSVTCWRQKAGCGSGTPSLCTDRGFKERCKILRRLLVWLSQRCDNLCTEVFVTHTFGKGSHQQLPRNFCIVPIKNILQDICLYFSFLGLIPICFRFYF